MSERHWIRLYYGQSAGKQLVCEVMLDNEVWEQGDTLPVSDARRIQQQIMMLARIHDLLTASTTSAGGQADRVSVNQLLTRLLLMLNTAVGQHQLSYEIDDLQLPVQKMTSLGLIVNELTGNAIKHGQGRVDVSFKVDGNTARLAVEDDGQGIPTDFDFRVGANIGLTLVDTLVHHDLGGSIEFMNA